MVRWWYGSGPILMLLLLHAVPAAAVVVVDNISARPNPAHFTRDNPAELDFEVAIRDRGMTRILGCQLALDFGDGTPDLTRQFMDGGPRKSSVKHVYRKPGIYNVRVRGVLLGRERACEGEKRMQVIVVGEPETGGSEAAREAAMLTLCPQGWSLLPGSQSGPRFKIQGVAQSATRVSSLMRNIAGSEWLKEPELEVVEDKKGNSLGSDFTLYADQVSTLAEAPPATGAAQPARRPQ